MCPPATARASWGSTTATPAASTPGKPSPPVQDPTLKRLFGHPEVVEILVRDILPEHADRIDFSTLEKLGTELVGEALARRYADMMWTARTRDGTREVVILTEFQGKPDRLMPLRTTIYANLVVQELLRRARPAPRPAHHRGAAAHGDLPRIGCLEGADRHGRALPTRDSARLPSDLPGS